MSELSLHPLKWSDLQHIDNVEPIGEKDFAVLEEVRAVLDRHGYMDRFGVCLLHKHFDLADDEYILEETDESERTQRLSVAKDDGDSDLNTIQTMWKFATDGTRGITKCVLRCHYSLGHKLRHFKEGH
jgi:hypothetical protein